MLVNPGVTDYGDRMSCDPVGSDDIAQRLGVKRDTVKMWKIRGILPEPTWIVSGRPCWNWEVIERWARKTKRLVANAEP